MRNLLWPNLWQGCVGAWCPSVSRSRSTVLEDFSPARNNGALTGISPVDAWKVKGSGNAFFAEYDAAKYIDIPNLAASLSLPFSVSLWCAPTSSYTYPFSIGLSGTGNRYCLQGSASRWAILLQPTTTFVYADAANLYTEGVFANVTMVFRSTTNRSLFFKNLEVNNTDSSSVGTIDYVNIHRHGGTALLDGRGYTDDIRIYNRALTPSEIQTLSLRRGIAYETRRSSRGKAAAAAATKRYSIINDESLIGVA